METRLNLAPLLALLVASSLLAPALTSTVSAAANETSSTCEQSVTHDVFRTTSAIETVNSSGEATSTVDNTDVRVEDVPGFVRLHADNPNGYCVSYVVEISPEIVAPADLGEIESLDGSTSASWRAEQNLTSGDVYTRVQITLPANTNASWAPSTVRVRSLAWTGTAKQESQGALSALTSFLGEDKLEQNSYTISPSGNSSRITVPLESKDGKTIEDWQATYTFDGTTRPVDQDASQPVYYTESGSSLTFHFNEEAVKSNATVSFVAEPNFLEKTRYSAESYWSGLQVGESWLPFTTSTGAIA